MPAEPSRAVFLSYASQDAEAARRICDALRSGGVDVWFDADGGLEHGDEWDQKIRRQVKECVLFIPVISANTQAREEGYFRIEWELAAQRAMGIASGVPFILPVVIDDTREPDALVPDRFRAVQWTRLRGGEVPPDVRARFLKLWSHRSGVLKNEAARATESAAFHPPPSPAESIGKPGAKTYALVAVAIAVVVGGAGWWMLHRSSPSAVPVASASTPAAKSTPATTEADQLTARAEASINKLNYTRETLAAADDLTRRAVELANDSAHAWAVRALVQASYLQRSWDFSEKRRQDTQEFARRSLAIDPNETTAMLATCYVLRQQRAFAQAEAMARQAVALRPNDYRLRASLIAIVSNQNRWEEAFTLAAESARMFPREPLVHYGLASGYTQLGRFDEALASYDAALAIQSFAGALLYKAILLAGWKGDLAAARATLDQLTPEERVEDRAVGVAMWLGLVERNPARVSAAAALTARNYFEDAVTPGAKAWSTALALQLDGKAALARQQWSAAEATLRERRRDHPDVAADQARLAITLVWLDRADEAAREIAPFEAAAREQPNPNSAALLAQYYASLGDAAKAVPYLRQMVNKLPLYYERTLPLDPWWDKIRRAPEFAALLAEAKPRPTAASAAPPAAPPALSLSNGLSPARELAEKALTLLHSIDSTREDFALAEDYCDRAMKLDSTDAVVWAAASETHGAFVYRGFDTTPERKEKCRTMAERAIRLAPNSAEAKLAQAGAWSAYNVNRAEIEKLLREILQERPNDQNTLKFLAVTALNRGALDECLALNERSAALPGGDPVALYNNALYLWRRNRPAEAYATLQRSLAQKPISSALVLMTSMQINWRGDLAAAEATLKQLSPAFQLEDRANFHAGLLAYYQRRPDLALARWSAFPRDYYTDFNYDGPKGYLVGLVHELAHRDDAAKLEWRTALQATEKRLAAAPNNATLLYHKTLLLACLGETAAAGETLRTYEQLSGFKNAPDSAMVPGHLEIYRRLGRTEEVLAHLPASLVRAGGTGMWPARLRFDPRFDPLRSDPRFEKLLAQYPLPDAEAKK